MNVNISKNIYLVSPFLLGRFNSFHCAMLLAAGLGEQKIFQFVVLSQAKLLFICVFYVFVFHFVI